jgi:hypothetical protein
MNELPTGPPSPEDGGGPVTTRAPHNESSSDSATTTTTLGLNDTVTSREAVDVALAEIRRRPYKPTCGIGAYHLRDGHRRGVRYACRELWAHLTADGRSAAELLVALAEAAADD